MVDQNFRRGLAVTIDAAVALLEPVGIPGDLVVDDPMAMPLEVDAFTRGVGGQEDANRIESGIGLEDRLRMLTRDFVHAAEEQRETFSSLACEAVGGEEVG